MDSLTWAPLSVLGAISARPQGAWAEMADAVRRGKPAPASAALTLHGRSVSRTDAAVIALMEHSDGQHVLMVLGKNARALTGTEPLTRVKLPHGAAVDFYEVTSRNLRRAYLAADPARLPSAMPMVPRLGIGTRMSRAVWPGIWQAVGECGFRANGIQNSVRELNLLEDLQEGRTSKRLYYPGIGFVPEGHTGSTFEGLWLCGVVEALKAGAVRYGADADHIMVKRHADGLERARKVLAAARNYSFYTIDVSDILDYSASTPAGKYRRALEALDALVPVIAGMKEGEPFDLELSIDEHPPEILPFDCLTTGAEVSFLLEECRQRGLPLTHLAPNLGVEKHVDYRGADGQEGLEARTRALHELAQERGVVIDIHSGDDLSETTRRTLKRATGGMIHFKISPSLQELFADVLYDFDPGLFRAWWDDTCGFARENAREGSVLASDCFRRYESEPGASPHPRFDLFRLFCYATVGKRTADGTFQYRERFYSLSADFYAEYTRRVRDHLCGLARDLLP